MRIIPTLLFLYFYIFANQAHAGMPVELFSEHPSGAGADVSKGTDPTVIRERLVIINIQSLSAMADQVGAGLVAQSISLNLFPDVRINFISEKTEKSRDGKFTILTGSISGGGSLMGNATFVFGDGVVTGNIRPGFGRMIYHIRVSPSGIHSVREVDAGKLPPESDPVPVAPPVVPGAGLDTK